MASDICNRFLHGEGPGIKLLADSCAAYCTVWFSLTLFGELITFDKNEPAYPEKRTVCFPSFLQTSLRVIGYHHAGMHRQVGQDLRNAYAGTSLSPNVAALDSCERIWKKKDSALR